MKSKLTKRIIALVLCMAMVLGCGTYALADDAGAEAGAASQIEQTISAETDTEVADTTASPEETQDVVVEENNATTYDVSNSETIDVSAEETPEATETEPEAMETDVEAEKHNFLAGEIVEEELTMIIGAGNANVVEEAAVETLVELSQEVDGTTITLSGPSSSFETDKEYSISVTKIENTDDIEEAIDKAAAEKVMVVANYQAFDIKLMADGVEVQPLGPVFIEFFGDMVESYISTGKDSVEVFHINNENAAEDMNAEVTIDKVGVEATSSSTYVVTDLKYTDGLYEKIVSSLESLEANDMIDYLIGEELYLLRNQIEEGYNASDLSDVQYEEVKARLDALFDVYYEKHPVAESGGDRSGFEEMIKNGWFEEYSEYANYTKEELLAMDGDSEEEDASLDVEETEMLVRGVRMYSVRRAALTSAVQIVSSGGAKSDDYVTVSKTIAGTDKENVFDITLTVETDQKISDVYKDPDVAVVLVMDLSYTMTYNFTGSTTEVRYAAAMNSADAFLQNFADKTTKAGTSQVGFVGFNTNAKVIFDLQRCATDSEVAVLKNTMRSKTGAIVNASGYNAADSRYTNIQAGLKRAKAMLDTSECEHKYIVLLTDGFPTTYIKSGYTGYTPESSSGTVGNDGVFYDSVAKKWCLYGTDYSNKAAIKARQMATTIKNDDAGIKIFSVGIDIGGQTIKGYLDKHAGKSFSTIDRTSSTYEIGSASDSAAYKTWLQNKIGSGKGYYYDSDNAAGMTDAFNAIFANIIAEIKASSTSEWVVTDPIPTGTGSSELIDFIAFYDKNNAFPKSKLSGSFGSKKENTASYANSKISWDLKNSGYTASTSDGKTTYTFTLKYRVRLENEDARFVEGTTYKTNGTTTLKYRVIDTVDGVQVKSDVKSIKFPIPSVKGYLAEFVFDKKNPDGNALPGAEFLLQHDTANCSVCRGDGKTAVTIADMTATSDANGKVTFAKVPSGHIYKLSETKAPEGYMLPSTTYTVVVAYDEITVTSDVDNVEWTGTVINVSAYELPSTGGPGIYAGMLCGLACLMAAAFTFHRRRCRVIVRR